MSKIIAIVGAGPGIGMAVARRFGSEDFQVALIARNEQSLENLARELEDSGIPAAAFKADVTDPPSLVSALAAARDRFGDIDVLEYSPTPAPETMAFPRAITAENVQHQFDFAVIGAVTCVQELLPTMLERKSGAFLFTSAASAITPVPFTSNFAVANAGLRSYVQSLNGDLAADGIYVGIVEIAGTVRKGGDVSEPAAQAAAKTMGLSVISAPDVGEMFWDMYTKRDRFEQVAGDIEVLKRILAGSGPRSS